MQFLTTFDWTYFQGYPRFHEAKYVELTTAGLSIHKWVQSSSRANSYFNSFIFDSNTQITHALHLT